VTGTLPVGFRSALDLTPPSDTKQDAIGDDQDNAFGAVLSDLTKADRQSNGHSSKKAQASAQKEQALKAAADEASLETSLAGSLEEASQAEGASAKALALLDSLRKMTADKSLLSNSFDDQTDQTTDENIKEAMLSQTKGASSEAAALPTAKKLHSAPSKSDADLGPILKKLASESDETSAPAKTIKKVGGKALALEASDDAQTKTEEAHTSTAAMSSQVSDTAILAMQAALANSVSPSDTGRALKASGRSSTSDSDGNANEAKLSSMPLRGKDDTDLFKQTPIETRLKGPDLVDAKGTSGNAGSLSDSLANLTGKAGKSESEAEVDTSIQKPVKVTVADQETHLPPVDRLSPVQQVVNIISNAASSAASSSETIQTASISLPDDSTAKSTVLRVLNVTLQPESLGDVSVRMRLADGRLELDVEVGREETQKLIDADKKQLLDSLRSSGYAVDSVMIKTMTAHGSQLQGDTNGQSQAQSQSSNGQSFQSLGSGESQDGQQADDRASSQQRHRGGQSSASEQARSEQSRAAGSDSGVYV
jgi:hypothetical protein